jgi:hypothetical protein
MELTKHHLKYLPRLSVTSELFRRGFASGCSMMNCDATCCKHGVYADLGDRANILAHAPMIQKHLEPQQEHDPAKWFDDEVIDDADYPSGHAVGTRATERGCVFLDKVGKCALQKAAVAEGMDRFALKPFYCVAYPVVIEHGVLMLDDSQHVNRHECCMVTDTPDLDVFDVCSEELEFVLGKEGFNELRAIADRKAPVRPKS